MDNLNLISNFAEFKELKNIDKATMIGVLEDVFRHALQKQFETDENFDVIINPEKGDLEIWRNRTVVEDGAPPPTTNRAASTVKSWRKPTASSTRRPHCGAPCSTASNTFPNWMRRSSTPVSAAICKPNTPKEAT